ncbi:MAG: hypothetical protein F6K58_19925 [Symploca sp. SIO2E9]|nr:hypothetical protein [Symploca sp. SIO2E9]
MSRIPEHTYLDIFEWRDGNWQSFSMWETAEIPPEGVKIPTQEGTYTISFEPSKDKQSDDFVAE